MLLRLFYCTVLLRSCRMSRFTAIVRDHFNIFSGLGANLASYRKNYFRHFHPVRSLCVHGICGFHISPSSLAPGSSRYRYCPYCPRTIRERCTVVFLLSQSQPCTVAATINAARIITRRIDKTRVIHMAPIQWLFRLALGRSYLPPFIGLLYMT